MDVTSISDVATNLSASATNQAVGIAVLKKAINLESAGALALVAAIPTVSSTNLPVNIGQNINVAV